MGKHSRVSSSTEWRLGENVVLQRMECLTATIKFDIFITIWHLFVSRPTLEFTTFEQRKCTIIRNEQLQKNGTLQGLGTAHIKQKGSGLLEQ